MESKDTRPRQPPNLPFRIVAHLERILVHDTGKLAGSAVDAVFICDLVFAVVITIATSIFILRLENVAGLMCEHLVNVVRPPVVVVVLHAEFHSAHRSIGEVGLRKLGEECDISASCVVLVAKIVGKVNTSRITL